MVLSRYFLARFVRAFLGILAILILGVVIVQLLQDVSDLMEAAKGPFGLLWVVLLRIPSYYLPLVFPFASFIAAFVALGMPARGLEIVAMKAGGVSPLRAAIPVLLAAALFSLFGLLLDQTVGLRAQDALLRLERGEGAELTFRRGSFWYHKGRYVYNVRNADASARLLEEVTVFELDESGRLVRSIHAARAEITGGARWHLVDAVIRRFDPSDPTSKLDYQRVASTELVLTEDFALLDADVDSLSILDLREYRDQQSPGDPEWIRSQALLHSHLTAPLRVFVFALLALPLALRVEWTKSLARPALHGVLLIFAFEQVRLYSSKLASQGVVAPDLASWAILAAFTLLGGWQLARVPR